jgi:Cu-processing system permease protein
MLYVPPRPLLTGEAAELQLFDYTLLAAAQALAWSVGLLAAASLIFRRRDFL